MIRINKWCVCVCVCVCEGKLGKSHAWSFDCRNIVIFQPKKLQNKFEDAQVKYDGDAVLYKMKSWVNDNM